MSEPDFLGIALAIELGGFEGADGHAAAEDGDGLSVIEGIFDNQPAADAEETDDRGDEYQQAEDAAGVPDVNARRRVGGRETVLN